MNCGTNLLLSEKRKKRIYFYRISLTFSVTLWLTLFHKLSCKFYMNVLLKSFIMRAFATKVANRELNNYSHLYFKQNIALIFIAQRQKRCGQKIKRLKSPSKFVFDLSCTMRNKVRHYGLSFYYFDALITILCYSRFYNMIF